jgi:hypothetical protein
MTKERSHNPFFPGSEKHAAWEKGYSAALADAAGIPQHPRRVPPFGALSAR